MTNGAPDSCSVSSAVCRFSSALPAILIAFSAPLIREPVQSLLRIAVVEGGPFELRRHPSRISRSEIECGERLQKGTRRLELFWLEVLHYFLQFRITGEHLR